MRSTHTYAVLEVSEAAYDEISGLLQHASYDHAFHEDDEHGTVIDMHGIGLARSDNPRIPHRSREALLDPAIRELLNGQHGSMVLSASAPIIGRFVSAYLGGAIDLDTMRGEMIKALAKAADDWFADLTRTLSLQPIIGSFRLSYFRDLAAEQTEYWKAPGLTPAEVSLTMDEMLGSDAEYRSAVSWAEIERRLLGWQIRDAAPVTKRKAG